MKDICCISGYRLWNRDRRDAPFGGLLESVRKAQQLRLAAGHPGETNAIGPRLGSKPEGGGGVSALGIIAKGMITVG